MNGGTIFLLSGDQSLREATFRLCTSGSIKVKAFEAVDSLVTAYSGEPGCIIWDVNPQLGEVGRNGILSIRGYRPSVVMVIQRQSVAEAVRAMQRGAVTVLSKPVSQESMWDAITLAIARDSETREKSEKRKIVRDRLGRLNEKQIAVFDRVLRGRLNKQIARELGVALRTVERRRKEILAVMEVDTTVELVQMVTEVRCDPTWEHTGLHNRLGQPPTIDEPPMNNITTMMERTTVS